MALLETLETMLRRLLLLLLLSIFPANAATLVLPDLATPEERAFATNLENALETTNIAALVSLYYCESDEMWAAHAFFRDLVRHPCDEIRLERSDSPDAAKYVRMLTGARSDLPLRWLVILRQPPLLYEAVGTNLTVLPVALFNGKIAITRRMAAFTPFQKRLLIGAAAVAGLLAVWYAVKFIRLRWRTPQTIYYTPAGLSILLLFFAAECLAVTFLMSWFAPHPLRLVILPVVGMLICFGTALYDDWAKSGATMANRLKAVFPFSALSYGWKNWRSREGPFASPSIRLAVLSAVALCAVWLGAYIWRGTSISLYAQYVQGTVTRCEPRGGVQYTYSVNGQQYSGSGIGSFDRVYPVGSPLDVKFSASHPAYSTIDDDPFLFLEQLAFGVVVMSGFFLLAATGRSPGQSERIKSWVNIM